MNVLVLDTNRKPLMPTHPARARKLISKGRASVFRHNPFTIIIHDRTQELSKLQNIQLKLDPGYRITGLALVAQQARRGKSVVWAGEIHHRAHAITQKMEARRSLRRGRRSRKTRYRKPRFLNRRRREGWLPPSVQHLVDTTLTWVSRLQRWAPVTNLSVELAKFDMQKMELPEIEGEAYQRGTLAGWNLREYLLYRHAHTCAYCQGHSGDPILELDHVQPRSRGGSNRVANLVIACHTCNVEKDNRTPREWAGTLDRRSKLNRMRVDRCERIAEGERPSLAGAAAINALRWALYRLLSEQLLPLEVGSGGRTKFNRTEQGYPKAHWIDAACVGESGYGVRLRPGQSAWQIEATGHGPRQRVMPDKYGFPKQHRPRIARFQGWKTGDIARVVSGKHKGKIGRVSIRTKPSFCFKNGDTELGHIHPKHLIRIHHADGYSYDLANLKEQIGDRIDETHRTQRRNGHDCRFA